jgi:hypothetical protein
MPGMLRKEQREFAGKSAAAANRRRRTRTWLMVMGTRRLEALTTRRILLALLP